MSGSSESISQLNQGIYEPRNFSSISEFYLREGANLSDIANECDPATEYTVNSYGLRSPALGLADLATIGCSQTFGMGVDDADIWPARLAEKLDCSYVNLGVPGASIQTIVSTAFAYIQQYGKPKTIAAVLPGYGRMLLPINSEYATFHDDRGQMKKGQLAMTDVNFAYREMNKSNQVPFISKRPHRLDELLTYEVALHQSMFALSTLIQYCKDTGIELIISTWNGAMADFIATKKRHPETKLDLSNFIEVHPGQEPLNCHEEFNSGYSNWNEGRDCGHHMGVHTHIHFAEAFAEKINNI